MSAYYDYVEYDDLTGAESRVRLPVARHAVCHRCREASASWYCRPCQRHLAHREWVAILLFGIPAGLTLIVLAVLMALGVAS